MINKNELENISLSSSMIDIFRKCEFFNDIYEYTEDMGKKEKRDLFEIITYFAFKLSPFLNTDIQNIWLYNSIPKDILTKLNLPSKDKGIDLLLEKNNEYYAIQCKFRQSLETVIKWGELSTFYGLTFGVANGIKCGYFVTNTTNMCDEVKASNKVKVINNTFFRHNLPNNFFINIINLIANKSVIKEQPKTPMTHQIECIKHYHHIGLIKALQKIKN